MDIKPYPRNLLNRIQITIYPIQLITLFKKRLLGNWNNPLLKHTAHKKAVTVNSVIANDMHVPIPAYLGTKRMFNITPTNAPITADMKEIFSKFLGIRIWKVRIWAIPTKKIKGITILDIFDAGKNSSPANK